MARTKQTSRVSIMDIYTPNRLRLHTIQDRIKDVINCNNVLKSKTQLVFMDDINVTAIESKKYLEKKTHQKYF